MQEAELLPSSQSCLMLKAVADGWLSLRGLAGKGPMETVPFRAITCPYLLRGGYSDSKSHLGTLLCLCCHGNRCLPQLCLLRKKRSIVTSAGLPTEMC